MIPPFRFKRRAGSSQPINKSEDARRKVLKPDHRGGVRKGIHHTKAFKETMRGEVFQMGMFIREN